MSAGLPGLGLGGIFFILSALLAPVIEVPRTIRGRSSVDRWRQIMRHLALATAMVAAVEATLRLATAAIAAGRGTGEGSALGPLPLPPVVLTVALLATVLAVAKGADLAARMRFGSTIGRVLRYSFVVSATLRRRLAERTET